MVSKGNHPQMALLIQVSELFSFAQKYIMIIDVTNYSDHI